MTLTKVPKNLMRFLVVRVLMALLLFITFAAWSMSSAVGGSPDEDFVLTSIWCGSEGNPPYCRKDVDRPSAMILPIMAAEPSLCLQQLGADYSAKCQESIYNQEISTDLFNDDLYPTRYFEVQRNLVSNDVEVSVLKMRFLNSLIAAVLVVVATSLYKNTNLDMLFFWLIAITPVSSYLITSINTSSWALIGTSCFVFALVSRPQSSVNLKLDFLAILFATLSLWISNSSRSESKFSIFILLLVIYLSKSDFSKAKLPKVFLKATATALVLICFVYVALKSLGTYDFFTRQRSISDREIKVSAENLIIQNLLNLPRFFTGFFGSWGLGSFELKLTSTAWLFAFQGFIIIAIFTYLKSSKHLRFVFCTLFVIMFFAILCAHQYKFLIIGEQIQPRYFLPFFLGAVIIVSSNKSAPFPNSLVMISAILATTSNSIALRDTIRRYTTGRDVLISKSINDPLEWWWRIGPQPETVWLSGSLAFAALFTIVACEQGNLKASRIQNVSQA